MLSKTKKTVLLVEDKAILALSTKKDLTKYGYNVLVVNSGEKAIEICKKNNLIDLILMDIDLGKGIDGTKAAELILNRNDIPVVFLSSHTEPEIVDKTQNIASYGYVVKSSSTTVLDASIKMAFKLFEAKTRERNKGNTLNENSEIINSIFSSIHDLIFVIDKNKNFTNYYNTPNSDLYITPDQFIGKSIYETLPPNVSEPLGILIDKVFKTGILQEFDYSLIADGKINWYSANLNPISNTTGGIISIVAVIRDITNRKLSEKSLKESKERLLKSEEKYRRLIENLSKDYYFYSHDKEGMKSYVSPSVTQMLGYTQKEAMYHYGTHLTDNPINDEVNAKTQKAIMGIKQPPYLAEIFHKDGSKRLIEVSETPVFDKNGNVIAIEGIAHDVTKSKQQEDKIKQQLKEKEVILKEVHHRIKNNFASIASLLSLQTDSLSNPETITSLNNAIGQVNSMKILYEKLLLTDNYNRTSLKQYLEDLIDDIITLSFSNTNITITKQIDDFQLDPKRLVPVGIIVNELLTNVMKYAFPGKKSGLIEITAKENTGNVIITIQDNGIGFPKEFNIDTQTSFGLMLVKMLSEQLKGNFSIKNNNGAICSLEFSI